MSLHLTTNEARILGALIEKEITTPDNYPLSLNALMNACNQKSNRNPEMSLDERATEDALRTLSTKNVAGRADNMDGRVTKYEHRLQEVFNFTRPETAILCELLLRGPQTPGELRSRAERMHHFDDLNAIHSTLQKLIEHNPPLVKILPRQPGTKEQRYTHLLSDESPSSASQPAQAAPNISAPTKSSASANPASTKASPSPSAAPNADRLSRLEQEVAALRAEITSLKQQLANFQKQFD